ncbi:MAG TPA: hypothetical protein VFF04_01780 [Candidatus Babeliales bacterium]|nr:hypothetical protein [Candidatus Babeliales bacterium]
MKIYKILLGASLLFGAVAKADEYHTYEKALREYSLREFNYDLLKEKLLADQKKAIKNEKFGIDHSLIEACIEAKALRDFAFERAKRARNEYQSVKHKYGWKLGSQEDKLGESRTYEIFDGVISNNELFKD